MKIIVALLLFLPLSASLLKAGTVYLIANKPEVQGKLTLAGTAIHVDGGTTPDIDLADVLEADLGDGDFHLDYFSSGETTAAGLPPGWKGGDIGRVDVPGTATFAKGAFAISGNGRAINTASDRYFYLSRPWTGNGVWTVHIKELALAEAGLLLRENLEPGAVMFGFGTGPVRVDNGANGLRHNRNNAGEGSQWNAIGVSEPFWLRIRRISTSFDLALSSDGRKWNNVEQDIAKFPTSFQAGFFIDSGTEDQVGKAVLDHVLFTPAPAEPETLPIGVLLSDGTFLAGFFNQLDPTSGTFSRGDQIISMTNDQVASVTFDPATMQQLAKVDTKTGILMQNGDFTESTLKMIQGSGTDTTSTVLGDMHYDSSNALAYVLRPVKPMPSDYEVRLKDGSDIRASAVSVDNGQLAINDVSGITVMAALGEVAQIRAGPALVQTLIDLPWKATPATIPSSDAAPDAAPAPSTPPATNVVTTVTAPAVAPAATNAVAAVTAPAPAPAMNENPSVHCWQGNNQEQIMVAAPGTSINFPLTGKFRGLAFKVALSPDAPPGSQGTVRILANGLEIGRTHPFKAGEQPRFVQIDLQAPKTVTLVAEAPGAKVLYIDPVAIRF